MWSISNRYSGNRFGCDFEGQYSRKTIYNPTKRTNFNPSTQYHNRELEINELKTEQIIIMKYFIKYVILASFFIYDWNITISITTLRKNDVPTKLWIHIDIFSNFPKRWIIRPISRDNNQFGLQQLISAASRLMLEMESFEDRANVQSLVRVETHYLELFTHTGLNGVSCRTANSETNGNECCCV